MKRKLYNQNHFKLSFAHLRQFRCLGIASCTLLGLLLLALIFPTNISPSHALDNTERSALTRISVDAAATIGVSLEDNVNLEITPKLSGQFSLGQTDLRVMTNNPTGYSIYLKTTNGQPTLQPVKPSSNAEDIITSITAATAGKDFTGNSWGYALSPNSLSDASLFLPIPTTADTPIASTNLVASDGGDLYHLGFGAHITSNLASGEYTNSVVTSVIANPNTITSLSDLVFMQDMSPEICAQTPSAFNDATQMTDRSSPYYLHPVEKSLVDLRDGKSYYVARLADGNCWMTQNLDYDLVAGMTLKPSDTNVHEDWLVPFSTESGVPAESASTADYNLIASWDLGKLLTANLAPSSICQIQHGQDPIATCPQYLHDVANLNPNFVATTTTALSPDGTSYDPHYLVGNYYTWESATAGSGSQTNTANTAHGGAGHTDPDFLVDATDSICPKGWQLPKSGTYYNYNNGVTSLWPYDLIDSFYRLLAAYGYPQTGSNDVVAGGWNNGNDPGAYTSLSGSERTRPDYLPAAFTRTGTINPNDGALNNLGHSFYWSSTAYPNSAVEAQLFHLTIGNAYPSYRQPRFSANTIRCLAK